MSTKGIAVAMIEPLGGHAGMSGYDLGLCRGLISAGCRVSWYTCDRSAAPADAELAFFPVFRGIFGETAKLLRGARFVAGALTTYARVLARGERVCHLHIFHSSVEELLLVMMAVACRRCLVLTVHDVDPFSTERGSGRWLLRRMGAWADRIIVHNVWSREQLLDRLSPLIKAPRQADRINPGSRNIGLARAKVRVVAHGNYLAESIAPACASAARQRLGIDATRRVVLFFGHIKQVKGLDLLLQAMAALVQELPDILLLVAGRPWKSDFTPYQAQIDRLDLSAHCLLHLRFIPEAQVPDYFAAANLVALPYRRIYQSGVILEAMSFRRAVLASDLPAMREIVTSEVNGLLFESEDVTALAAALRQALGDLPRLEAMGLRSREYVERQHDWNTIGIQTAAIYREILQARW
jgi:glycosyltransferase involved in cell wall biosynthesis